MFDQDMRVGKRSVVSLPPPSGWSYSWRVPSRPLHSLNPPSATLATALSAPSTPVLLESISATTKLKLRAGSRTARAALVATSTAMTSSLDDLQLVLGARDAEDHELRRLHRGHAHVDDDFPRVDDARGVVVIVRLHEVGRLRRRPGKGASFPDALEEAGDRHRQLLPQVNVGRLECAPLHAARDRLLDRHQEAPDVHEAPRRIAAHRPRAEDANSSSWKCADAVDPDRVERFLELRRDVRGRP